MTLIYQTVCEQCKKKTDRPVFNAPSPEWEQGIIEVHFPVRGERSLVYHFCGVKCLKEFAASLTEC